MLDCTGGSLLSDCGTAELGVSCKVEVVIEVDAEIEDKEGSIGVAKDMDSLEGSTGGLCRTWLVEEAGMSADIAERSADD